MSQKSIWNLEISFVGSGEEAPAVPTASLSPRGNEESRSTERARGGMSLTRPTRLGPPRWLP
jgi:hypothetical protein